MPKAERVIGGGADGESGAGRGPASESCTQAASAGSRSRSSSAARTTSWTCASGQTAPHAGEPAPEPEPADHLLQDMYFTVQDPRETLPDLPWLIPMRRPPPLIRRDGPLRVTLASVPVGESVSRTGKKPRPP
jgi:hypothetical protein